MMAIKVLVLAGVAAAQCPYCPPGSFLASTSSCRCSPCANNTFTDNFNLATKCKDCTKDCPKSKVLKKQCTDETDIVCECPAGQYFDMGLLFCIDCTACPVGQGSLVRCTSESNTNCQPCIEGKTYSNSSRMSSCDKCTQCKHGFHVQKSCNITRNTICQRNIYSYVNITSTKGATIATGTKTQETTQEASPSSRINGYIIPSIITASIVVVFFFSFIIWCCWRKRNRGLAQTFNEDSHEEKQLQEIQEKPLQFAKHSGLRGRHVRNPRRLEKSRRKLADPSSKENQLLNSEKLLRDVPYSILEELALKLNPRSMNNWASLAGQLGYQKEKIDYFGMQPENATQRMLSDWQTSNASTVGVLYRHLKNIERDDAAEKLEVLV